MSSPIQRSLASRRVYVRQGPAPECPAGHGTLTWTLGGYRCEWSRQVQKKDSGGWYWATERCKYWTADRRETEVEAWEEPDDGIRLE